MAFFKTVLRMFKSNFGRFIALTAIMLIGIALMTGIGEVSSAMKSGGHGYLTAQNVPDIIVKSTSAEGFSDKQLEEIAALDFASETLAFTSYDTDMNDVLTRIYYLPLTDINLNKLELGEGELPQSSGEVLVERETLGFAAHEVGDTIEYWNGYYTQTLTVSGIVINPLLFSKEPEPSTFESDPETWEKADEPEYKDLEAVIYFDINTFDGIYLKYMNLPATDVYIKVSGASEYDYFSSDYKKAVAAAVAEIEGSELGSAVAVLSLEENFSYVLYKENINKISVISFILPGFFIAVVALVMLTTMTRLIEKDRAMFGCYKTLGVSSARIRFKYVLFILICFALGAAAGLIIGSLVIMPIVYSAYTTLFLLPSISGIYLAFGLISAVVILAVVLVMTLYVISTQLKEKPAALLRPKAPKSGKKIILERVPIIWNRFKFKYKSTYRNIFRNIRNFIMTVVSVAGSTALVFAGFGLYSAAGATPATSTAGHVSETISLISVVVIICAALLSILVMYNMTNTIIEERRREIATLKVLGYKSIELAGYIFREVLIMAAVGIIIGIPVGMLLVEVVFNYVNFGALADVAWYMYVATFLLAFVFIGIVDLFLYRKITKTDMNDSLKSVE